MTATNLALLTTLVALSACRFAGHDRLATAERIPVVVSDVGGAQDPERKAQEAEAKARRAAEQKRRREREERREQERREREERRP